MRVCALYSKQTYMCVVSNFYALKVVYMHCTLFIYVRLTADTYSLDRRYEKKKKLVSVLANKAVEFNDTH